MIDLLHLMARAAMADAEEAWLSALRGFLGAVPLPATFPDAVACLEGVGVDVAAVRARVAAWLALPAANRHAMSATIGSAIRWRSSSGMPTSTGSQSAPTQALVT